MTGFYMFIILHKPKMKAKPGCLHFWCRNKGLKAVSLAIKKKILWDCRLAMQFDGYLLFIMMFGHFFRIISFWGQTTLIWNACFLKTVHIYWDLHAVSRGQMMAWDVGSWSHRSSLSAGGSSGLWQSLSPHESWAPTPPASDHVWGLSVFGAVHAGEMRVLLFSSTLLQLLSSLLYTEKYCLRNVQRSAVPKEVEGSCHTGRPPRHPPPAPCPGVPVQRTCGFLTK